MRGAAIGRGPGHVTGRVALYQRSQLVEVETLKQVGLLTSLRHAVAQLENHVTLAVALLLDKAATAKFKKNNDNNLF